VAHQVLRSKQVPFAYHEMQTNPDIPFLMTVGAASLPQAKVIASSARRSRTLFANSAASESSIATGIPNTRAQVALFPGRISCSFLLTDLTWRMMHGRCHRDTRKDMKGIKSSYAVDRWHPVQIILPFKCPYVLNNVRDRNYGSLSSPGLLFEPVPQDELDMEEK
jgi:hypothetical protein